MSTAPDAALRTRASIVIPVYNQAFFTRVCLTSLEREQGGAEVIVVDNGSTDDSATLLGRWHDPERGRIYVRRDDNLGFARACNLGAETATREFLVFLNNDTFVLEDWLANLLRPFDEDRRVMITGSRLLYTNGRLQHAGVAFTEQGSHHIFVGQPGDARFVLERRDYQAVTGASLAIRRTEFERLGGFDTEYVNSFEDVDLCLRVHEAGGRIVYVPDSVAYHFESMTEGRLDETDVRNYDLFYSRWHGRWDNDLERVVAEVEAAGHDLSDRAPAKRELIDRARDVERFYAELDELRHVRRMRSVRVALWARGAFRRVFPRRAAQPPA